MKKIHLTAMATALLAGLGVGSAHALTVNQVLFTGEQLLSDNSAEILIDMGFGDTTALDIGDRLRGQGTLATVEQGITTRFLGEPSANDELAFIFDVTVTGKVASATPGLFDYTFAPTLLATSGFGAFGSPVGTAVVMFADDAQEYTRLGCTAGIGGTCEGNIINGDVFWNLGFGGDGINFWSANDAPEVPSLFDAATGGGQFYLALSQLAGGIGPNLDPSGAPCADSVTGAVGPAEVCGNGNLLSPLAGAPHEIWDNADFSINVVPVPEPASLALLGIGLLGLGATNLRRKKV